MVQQQVDLLAIFQRKETHLIVFCTVKRSLRAEVPNFFGTRDQFRGRQFFHRPVGGGDGFGMIQAHYIYCALYFYYYYVVIYNEIIIQLTITQNQWEP